MHRIIILLLFIIIFSGCHYNKPLAPGYELSAIDTDEAMSIYYYDNGMGIGVINPTVFAVGYNEDFIIAKQHPRKFPNPPDKSITNYFIIPIKDKVRQSPDDNKIGPLTESEFKEKRKELGIPDEVTFSIVIKDLE